MKFLSLILICSFFTANYSLSQNQEINKELEKKQEYEMLLQIQNIAEENARYKGEDEIVRNRLGLPPKLLAFEDWIKNQEKDTKEVEVVEKVNLIEDEIKNDKKINSTEKDNSFNDNFSKNLTYIFFILLTIFVIAFFVI
jgi:hypothetical protein